MPRPLVSVLIPAYNSERYVGASVASALAQTYPNVEVVVVDDGSTDGTLDALRQVAQPNVRVVQQVNGGASAARNRALELAQGAYVQFLDADDLLAPDKVERQVDLLEKNPAGCVAVCGTVYFADDQPPESGRFVAGYEALDSDDPVQWLVDLWTPGPGYGQTRWGMVQPGAWLTPRGVIDAAGPWDEHPSPDDDGEYFTRVLLASRGVRWEPYSRSYYRQFDHSGSLSRQTSPVHLRGRLRSVDSKARHILPRTTPLNRDQARAALARQFLDVAFHAFPEHADVAREAEHKAAALGGFPSVFFEHSRVGHRVERAFGWKAAKRLSVALHALHTSASR